MSILYASTSPSETVFVLIITITKESLKFKVLISYIPVNSSVPSISVPAHAIAPATWTADAPAQHLIATPVIEQHHRGHKIILLVVIGIMVTGLAFLLILILVLLISRKRRELKSMEGAENTYCASPPIHVQKSQEGDFILFYFASYRRHFTRFVENNIQHLFCLQ